MTTQTSNFSWRRVAQLYQYNAPWIRKQTTIYFLFSLITALLYISIPSETTRLTVYGSCCTVLQFMFIWAPVVFTKGGDNGIIDRLIPASPTEKFMFYLSYLFIVIGMACFFCPWVAEKLYRVFYPGEEGIVDTIKSALDIPVLYKYSNYLSVLAAMITCFYCVVAVKRDRVMKAYLISICVLILTSLMNSFYGIKESVMLGFNEAIKDSGAINETEIVEKVYNVMTDHLGFLIFCMTVSVVYIFLLMWLSYRSLYRRNL
ncbi:MAG: hypothetical protein K2N09_06930 [Muribaculaceae bacterium]|nr:hypothetical protein [Muribaculaceae bacterium]